MKAGIKVEIKEVMYRICMITSQIYDRNHIPICVYAPTLTNSEKKPEKNQFCKDLESIKNGVIKRNILCIATEFNTKTRSGYKNYQKNVGFYENSTLYSNGEHLLDIASRHNIVLTSTTFNHKKAHRTTWEGPQKTNTNRKNPIINRIDYILLRNEHQVFLKDSRSYMRTITQSDH